MPDFAQMVDLGFAHATERKLAQQFVERCAMQRVEMSPWLLAVAHAVHRRVIARAPGIGELRGIELDALRARDAGDFSTYAGAPVDHGAEHVEHQRLNGFELRVHRHSGFFDASSVLIIDSRWP